MAPPGRAVDSAHYAPVPVAKERRARQKELEAAKKEAARKAASRKELFRRIRIAFGMGAVVVLLLLLISYLGSSETGQPDRYLTLRDQPTACGAETPSEQTMERWAEPADQAIEGSLLATVTTSCGDLVIELDPTLAPESVNAFVFLARQGAYDGTIIDFVDPSLWIQGGDPEADGTGTFFMDGRRPVRPVPDEFPPEDWVMDTGTVVLAGDRATRGSSFFVVTGEGAPISNRFNVIGRLAEGRETLEAITAIERKAPPGSGARTAPAETVYIETITITEP